jgi:hypothetical protein
MVIAEAERTLVKSPPELWSELSDPTALARHLGELGEIRIVRTQPEQSVEWEAQEHTRGTVEIKPSGWGTKVTLSVTIEQPRAEPGRAGPRDGALSTPPAPGPTRRDAANDGAVEPEPGRPREPVRGLPQDVPAAAGPPPRIETRAINSRRSLADRLSRLWRGRRALRRAEIAADEGELLRDDEPRPLAVTLVTPESIVRGDHELAAADPAPTPQTAPAPDPAGTPAEITSQTATSSAEERDRNAEQQAAEQTTALLSAVLDSLGEAHHRPFSRS